MAKQFRNWVAVLDQDSLTAMADPRGWIIVLASSFCCILTISLAPLISTFFETDFRITFTFWLVLLPVGILISIRWIREQLTLPVLGCFLILVSFVLQLFLWSLVISSSLMGGAVLAACPVLLASYHGQFFQVSLEYPFGVLSTILAVIGAFIVDSDHSHLAILALGGFSAIGAALVMGGNERRRLVSVREKEALRAALDAQILYEQSSEVENAQSAMQEIRGTNHDAGNILSGILMNLQFLTKRIFDMESGAKPPEDLLDISQDLDISVNRLRKLIERGRDIGGEISSREFVSLNQVLEQVVSEHRPLFPKIHLLSTNQCSGNINLSLPGGEETLHRILTNVIRNACEGEGLKSASSVEVSLTRDDENGWIIILVRDNGPGFTEEQLNTPVSHFKTTKSTGTGLGLYTTHRLIAASKGQLVLKNHVQGGAEVRIMLPVLE